MAIPKYKSLSFLCAIAVLQPVFIVGMDDQHYWRGYWCGFGSAVAAGVGVGVGFVVERAIRKYVLRPPQVNFVRPRKPLVDYVYPHKAIRGHSLGYAYGKGGIYTLNTGQKVYRLYREHFCDSAIGKTDRGLMRGPDNAIQQVALIKTSNLLGKYEVKTVVEKEHMDLPYTARSLWVMVRDTPGGKFIRLRDESDFPGAAICGFKCKPY